MSSSRMWILSAIFQCTKIFSAIFHNLSAVFHYKRTLSVIFQGLSVIFQPQFSAVFQDWFSAEVRFPGVVYNLYIYSWWWPKSLTWIIRLFEYKLYSNLRRTKNAWLLIKDQSYTGINTKKIQFFETDFQSNEYKNGRQMSWSANVLVDKCLGRQMSACLGWQISRSANVWVGKCLLVSVGKCLGRQMSWPGRQMSNRQMSGSANVRSWSAFVLSAKVGRKMSTGKSPPPLCPFTLPDTL